MKPIAKKFNRKAGFTIVELLTVMSIIIILMGLLAPAMNTARRYATKISQKNQLHSIDVALEVFRAEFDGYPDSDENDAAGASYCGAMKLAEAMMGQDLLGFHPDSRFRSDGTDGGTPPVQLYTPANVTSRIDTYLPLENAKAHKLKNMYGSGETGSFNGESFVLCDVYKRVALKPDLSDPLDKVYGRTGMPILYYRAHTSNIVHDVTQPLMSIYNYLDNHKLVGLGMPWNLPPQGPMHKLFHDPPGEDGILGTADDEIEGEKFYIKTRNKEITTMNRPYRADSFILISDGFDGQYGTGDDVFNFSE